MFFVIFKMNLILISLKTALKMLKTEVKKVKNKVKMPFLTIGYVTRQCGTTSKDKFKYSAPCLELNQGKI